MRYPTAALVALLCLSAAASAQSPPVWRADLAKAEAEAKASGKLLFLDFGAEWCGPCQKLAAGALKDARVLKVLSSKYVAVKLDAEQHRAAFERFGVKSMPTLLVVDASSREVARKLGNQDAADLAGWLSAQATPRRPEPKPADPWLTLHARLAADLARAEPAK